jgi:D-arabinose 5-phosphate isomerase GutQ
MKDREAPDKSLSRAAGLALAQKMMRQEAETIQTLMQELDDAFWECAQLLGHCAGLIWVTGVGTSAIVGMRFAHLLTCCGMRSMFLSPADGLHGHTGVMGAEDILVAMSRGGESSEVNQMVGIANQRRVTTIAFVSDPDSAMAQACRYVLLIRSKAEYELMGYLATTSTIAFAAVCDGLCSVILKMNGYTPEEFGRTHPGGAVGKMLGRS